MRREAAPAGGVAAPAGHVSLTAFIRYLEALQAAQGRSHEVTVGDAAGISDRIGEVRIATGTGHGLARVSGTGTGDRSRSRRVQQAVEQDQPQSALSPQDGGQRRGAPGNGEHVHA